jgi:hypothetical protein
MLEPALRPIGLVEQASLLLSPRLTGDATGSSKRCVMRFHRTLILFPPILDKVAAKAV